MTLKPGRKALLDDIHDALPKALGTSGLRRLDANQLYEAVLWAQSWRAAKDLGLTPLLRDQHDTPATHVHLRKGPSEFTSSKGYTHLFVPQGAGLEIHQGIYLDGTSGAKHQADLAILAGKEATRARATPTRRPRATGLRLGLEAKAYARTLPINVARDFLGLRLDFAKRFALVTSAAASTSGPLLAKHAPGVDSTFFECGPGTRTFSELRAILTRCMRGSG
ncbi:MAG: hypothetical protein WKF96_07930 [Solirubrobacteraceae bacterium]